MGTADTVGVEASGALERGHRGSGRLTEVTCGVVGVEPGGGEPALEVGDIGTTGTGSERK